MPGTSECPIDSVVLEQGSSRLDLPESVGTGSLACTSHRTVEHHALYRNVARRSAGYGEQ
jgi:hypothetical protein